tara:strand:+ start:539 stop:862 length:324 start_codon:yes stop_codon:yes gene_type:complete
LEQPRKSIRRYRGDRTQDGAEVWVDGTPLPNRTDLKKISRDGLFEWSYEGAEPTQLALAMLADHLQDDTNALFLHENFMKRVVAYFDNDWEMTSSDIDRALKNISNN